MPDIDDLEVIRELLTGKPPSQDVNDYVTGRLAAVIAAAESHPGAGRPMRRSPRSRRTVAGVAQRRGRRLALRSLAGVAAVLAAGAVALVAVGVPGGIGGPVVAAASVVKRVDSALSAASPADIAQMTVTTSSVAIPGGTTVTTTSEEWSYADQWRLVTSSPAGHRVYDEGFSNAPVYTLVSYLTRTWARQPGLGRPSAPVSGPRSCEPAVAAGPLLFQPGPPVKSGLPGIGHSVSSLPATVATALRTAVSCGTLAVAGRQRVDGIEAIELTSRSDSLIPETIWVSPGTYLPVRVVVRPAPGAPVLRQTAGIRIIRLTADITWLAPTVLNLAKLTVPVPAGFRLVPLGEAVGPIMQQALGGPLP
jgi:hypothetical protein